LQGQQHHHHQHHNVHRHQTIIIKDRMVIQVGSHQGPIAGRLSAVIAVIAIENVEMNNDPSTGDRKQDQLLQPLPDP
jgi:hypothetical protein